MKLILLLIGLTLCASGPSLRTLAQSDDLLQQIRADAEANDSLNFGANTIIAQGIKDTKIPNANFAVSGVSSYSKTSNANGNLYKFTCVANNADGSSVVHMNFTVNYQSSNQKRTLSSYSFNVKTRTVTPNQPVADYVQLGNDEINTDIVQQVLNYGTSQIYAIGSQSGKIPVSDFVITSVVSVWKQVTTIGTNYRCQVVLENNNKVTINANFIVLLKSANQKTSLSQYSYTVSNINSNTNNTTTPTTPVTDTTNDSNTANNTDTNTTVDSFTALTQEEIQNSAEVQGALNYGANQTLQFGYAKGRIPVSDYSISKVISVGKQVIIDGRNAYKCSVEIADAQGILVQAQYVIYVNVSTQEMTVRSWAYQIFNLGSTDGSSPNTDTTNNTNTDNTNNNTVNNNNTTQPTNTDNTNTDNTSTDNTNNTTADPYTALTQEEIQSSAEVQSALIYGGNQTIQYGYAKNKIPVSIYSITQVLSVGKQATNGRNAYKCSVEIEDPRGVLVKAQYVIYVNVSTQEMTVNSWAYQIFNLRYADNPFPTTNTTNTDTTNNNTGNNNNSTQPTNTDNTNTNTNTDNTNTGNTNSNNNTNQPNTDNTTPSNTNNTSTVPDNYIELETSEIESSAEVQGGLNYGINQVLQSGYAKSKIPVSTYTISKINSVERAIINTDKNAYRCDVELEGANNVLVKTQFVVNVKVSTQEYSIGTWTYSVSNLGSNSNSNNTTNSGNNGNTSTNTNTNNNANTNANNNNTNVNTNTNTNTQNTPTQPANPTNTASNYTALSQAEINTPEVQGALYYGANQTLQSGYTKGRIPVSDYSISKVVSVGKQATNGKSAYQCSIELLGANKVVVSAQFVVNVKVSTQEMSMGGWSYQVGNLPSTSNTSNNTKA